MGKPFIKNGRMVSHAMDGVEDFDLKRLDREQLHTVNTVHAKSLAGSRITGSEMRGIIDARNTARTKPPVGQKQAPTKTEDSMAQIAASVGKLQEIFK